MLGVCTTSSLTVPLDDREAGSGGNATLVVLVAGHLDVALVTPGGAPAVLHQPVLLPHLAAIAHHQNAVVQLGAAALRLIVHTCGKTWVQSVHAYPNHHQNTMVQLGAAALRLIVHTCSKTWAQSVHAYSNPSPECCGPAALMLTIHTTLQALVYNSLHSTIAIFSYAIGSKKLSANKQFFVGTQTVVSLLQTTQIIPGICFINDHVAHASSNKTKII